MSGPAGDGTDSSVLSLTTYDGDGPALYAAGRFGAAGGETVNGIARWDGNAWGTLSGPAGTGIDGLHFPAVVRALATYDDGNGVALFAGGTFDTAGGLGSRNLARWLCTAEIFSDGFESGDLSAWSGAAGGP